MMQTDVAPPNAPEAPVSDLDPYDADALRDPYPHYAALRDAGPLVWLHRYRVWAVARYQEVQAVLTDPVTYCSGAGVGLANFHTESPWRKPSLILEADPPLHGRTRKVVARLMSTPALVKLRATFEAEAEKLIEQVVAKGSFDAVPDLAEAYPLKVFADAVGVPAEGREHLLPYGDMVFNGFGPINERFNARMATSKDAISWITSVCQREALTPDGFGAQLFAAADAGEITHEEASLLVRTLLSAGLDTTVFTIGNAIACFARQPEQWAMVRDDPSLARQAIEEVLRYECTFHSFYRTTTRPVEFAGIPLAAQQKILVLIASANRDPRRWTDPDAFDVHRKGQGSVAFGTGIHGCAGQMMARLEGEIVLKALARRVEFDRTHRRAEAALEQHGARPGQPAGARAGAHRLMRRRQTESDPCR